MKELLIKALDEAYSKMLRMVPQTKKQTIYVPIEDVEPLELVAFMKEKSIPNDAYFGGTDNGYDGIDKVCLCYDKDIPTTEQDKTKYKQNRFNSIAWRFVFDSLTSNGYKKISSNSASLRGFNNEYIYTMYMNKDFDILVTYYSYSFVLEN